MVKIIIFKDGIIMSGKDVRLPKHCDWQAHMKSPNINQISQLHLIEGEYDLMLLNTGISAIEIWLSSTLILDVVL